MHSLHYEVSNTRAHRIGVAGVAKVLQPKVALPTLRQRSQQLFLAGAGPHAAAAPEEAERDVGEAEPRAEPRAEFTPELSSRVHTGGGNVSVPKAGLGSARLYRAVRGAGTGWCCVPVRGRRTGPEGSTDRGHMGLG